MQERDEQNFRERMRRKRTVMITMSPEAPLTETSPFFRNQIWPPRVWVAAAAQRDWDSSGHVG